MTIVDKIINSIQAVLDWDEIVTNANGVQTTVHHTFPVYYNDDPDMNMEVGSMVFPCAFFQLLTSGRVVNEAGQLKERVFAGIFFVELAEWDCKATDNEAVIDRCKQRGMKWLSHLSLDPWIAGTMENTARKYADTDDIVTGWGVFVNITELEGFSGCETETEQNQNTL